MASFWDTFNSNRTGLGGFSDWGLSTSTSYPGSFDFGGIDDFVDPYAFYDEKFVPLVIEPNVRDLLETSFDFNDLLRSYNFDLPYTAPVNPFNFDDLVDEAVVVTPSSSGRPQINTTPGGGSVFNALPPLLGADNTQSGFSTRDPSYPLYVGEALFPGIMNQINPYVQTYVPGTGFTAEREPSIINQPNPYVETYIPGTGFTADEDEVLEPSGRPRDNTTPGGGSTANTNTGGPALPGTPGGSSVREPSDRTPTDGGGGDSKRGDGDGGGGGGIQLPSIGGLAASALGLALLREFLGLFDRDESTYQGIDMPTVRDITAPQTPRIAPARVVPYETYAPQSRPATRFSENPIEGLGRAEGGLATALRPHMLAVGGRADYREGAPVVGKGTGQSDDIPALLSDGEYVIDADTVAALGDGSNKAGAKVLDEFRELIRQHKRAAPADKIPPKAKSPLAYLKEAKKNG